MLVATRELRRPILSLRARRSDCRRRFVLGCALVGGFAAALASGFLSSGPGFSDDSRCLDVIVLGLPKGTRGTA